jgi:glycerophosphoryl diester phosphodiesterase
VIASKQDPVDLDTSAAAPATPRAARLIAHRAGNMQSTISRAAQVADAIELDVHRFRGRLEVRHAKVLWPFAVRWDRWEVLAGSELRPTLQDIVEHVPAGTHLWIDLKGATPRLTRDVLGVVGDRFALTFSSRAWWILSPAQRVPGVRVMRSVGSRLQLWAVQRSWFQDERHGVAVHERLVSRSSIERVRPRSGDLVVWAVTDHTRLLELEELGVTGFIIDDLELIEVARRA